MSEMQEHASETPPALPLYLLAIRGTLAPATLDAARDVHNATAGARRIWQPPRRSAT